MGGCNDCVCAENEQYLFSLGVMETDPITDVIDYRSPKKIAPNNQIDLPVTQTKRNRPPFPNLQSYNITCIVLGYTGYADEIRDLLSRLSHKTATYSDTHAPILRGALVTWESKIVAIVQFEDLSQSSTLTQKVEYKMTPKASSGSKKTK